MCFPLVRIHLSKTEMSFTRHPLAVPASAGRGAVRTTPSTATRRRTASPATTTRRRRTLIAAPTSWRHPPTAALGHHSAFVSMGQVREPPAGRPLSHIISMRPVQSPRATGAPEGIAAKLPNPAAHNIVPPQSCAHPDAHRLVAEVPALK